MNKPEEGVTSAVAEEGSAPAPALGLAKPVLQVTGHPGLGACECGSDTFLLANELKDAAASGLRSSRMYECVACGKYRLFK